MAPKRTIIEIKGKLYDADTGQPVDANEVASKPQTPTLIDGFKAPLGTTPQPQKPQPQTPQPVAQPQPTTPQTPRPTMPSQNIHQKVRKSSKLHSSIQPPQITPQPSAPEPQPEVKPQVDRASLHQKVDDQRLQRANEVQRSQLIDKYGAQPAVQPTPQPVAQPAPQPEVQPIQPEPAPQPEIQATETQTEKKSFWQKTKDKFSGVHRKKPKLFPALGGTVALLLIGGYLVYMNLPSINLKLASTRAGFEVSIPGYKPSGFSFEGPVESGPGLVSLGFESNSDNRRYKITQRPSTWDSQSLLDNHVVGEDQEYITFQDKGLTVYVYDDSRATWVDEGVWYTIEGDSLLSSEQLLKIASSL